MKMTLKELARRTGVSTATVSMVLNGKPCRVSEDTKAAILRAARETGYVPNQAARSLKLHRSDTFGFLVPDVSNVFYSDMAKLVEEHSDRRGYRVMIGNSNGLYKRDYEYLRTFTERGVDAIIWLPSSTFDQAKGGELFQMIRQNPVPIIAVDHDFDQEDITTIRIDHVLGGYAAARHLLSLGHRRIGLCAGPRGLSLAARRVEGYRKALAEFGCELDPDLVYHDNFDIPSGEAALDYFLTRQVTGICCSNDMMALGVYRRCAHFGISIPRDLSVVGYDDILLTQTLTPSLTTLAVPTEEISRRAVDTACRLIAGEEADRRQVVVPQIVVRGSTAYTRS